MTSRFISFVALCAVALGAFAGGGGRAQDTPKAATKRTLYHVQHRDAKDLAAVLSKHFKGDADIQAVPGEGFLLVSATPAVVEEVTKLLGTLDRRPRRIVVTLHLIEAAAKADDKALDETEFTGPEKAVFEKVEALRKKGGIGEAKRLQFSVTEGSPTAVTVGTSTPVTTGASAMRAGGKGLGGAPGLVTRSITYRELGTNVTVTAHVTEGKSVALELQLAENRMAQSKEVVGQDENGAPIFAPEFIQAKVTGKCALAPGQAVAAKDVQTSSKSGLARTLVIAVARIAEPEGGGK